VSSRVIGFDRSASRGDMDKRLESGRPRRRVPNPPRGEGRVSSASALLGVLGTSITSEESNELGGDGVDGARAVVDAFSTSFAVRAFRAATVPLTDNIGSDFSPAGVKSSRFFSFMPRICSALLWDGPGLRGGASRADS